MGETGPMLRAGINYKSIGHAPLKHYSDTLNEIKLAKRLCILPILNDTSVPTVHTEIRLFHS